MKCLFWHETSSCNPRGKSTDAGRDEKPVGERMVGKPDYPVHFITQKLLTPDAPSALNSRSRPFHDSISATSDLGPVTRFSCCKDGKIVAVPGGFHPFGGVCPKRYDRDRAVQEMQKEMHRKNLQVHRIRNANT